MPTFPLARVPGTASRGGLKIPDGTQQSRIVQRVLHQARPVLYSLNLVVGHPPRRYPNHSASGTCLINL